MNIVIYARFSSHSQNEQSIEGQLNTCYEFAKKNGYTIIAEYIDRALSGTTDNRPQFQKMIEDSSKKHFQYVLVYQLDRFARNRYDSATYKARLKKNGVRVLSARENISDDASGILVEGLLESMAEYYSAELSQKIRRGMEINASKCLRTGGGVALGYKIDENKRFVIDEDSVSVVISIFEMYASGKTVTEITTHLNSRGLKTSKGADFNKNSLRKMLQNRRYLGIYTYRDTEIPDGMPRIISDELFYKVQEVMSKNRKAPARAKAKEEYILTTKLFCGYCKEMMRGYGGTGKLGKAYYYYACNGMIKKLCKKKIARKQEIEDYVVTECRKLLTNENIDKIAHEVVALCEKEKDTTNLKRLTKVIKENERKRSNVAAAIAECNDESVRKLMYEQVPKLESERAVLERELTLEQIDKVSLSVTDIKFFLNELKKGHVNDIKYRKTLINIFVNAIYLYDDKISFIFNSGGQPVTIDDKLFDEIDNSNNDYECSLLDSVAPFTTAKFITDLAVFCSKGNKKSVLSENCLTRIFLPFKFLGNYNCRVNGDIFPAKQYSFDKHFLRTANSLIKY